MADFLQQIRDKSSINGKLFKYKDKFGLIIQYISAKDITEYDYTDNIEKVELNKFVFDETKFNLFIKRISRRTL